MAIVVRDHPLTKDKWKSPKKKKNVGKYIADAKYTVKNTDKKAEKEASDLEKILKKTAKQRVRLMKVAKARDYTDKNSVKLLTALRAMMLNMLPRAERTYQTWGNDKAAYALNALVSQIREIENDLRLVADLGHQADRIVDLVANSFRSLAQQIAQKATFMKRNTVNVAGKRAGKVNDLIDDFIKDFAQSMDSTLLQARDDIFGLMTEPKPKQTRKKRK